MAINLKKQGWLDESLKYYKKALVLEPKNHNFLYNVGLLYAKRNEYQKAIEKFQKSIEIWNNNPYSYLALADAYEKKQDIPMAIKTYQDLLKLKLDIHGLKEKIEYLKQLLGSSPNKNHGQKEGEKLMKEESKGGGKLLGNGEDKGKIESKTPAISKAKAPKIHEP